jgi:beta-xylosidase
VPFLALLLLAWQGLTLLPAAHQPRAAASPLTPPAVFGPAFASDFPDPSVIRVGNDFYAYGTSTDWEVPSHLFPILTSRDLFHWQYVGDAFVQPPGWSIDNWWAPSVVQRGTVFYLFYGARSRQGTHCIGVATAGGPLGPFIDRSVIGCGDADGTGYIDPAPLLWGDAGYLYFAVDGPRHCISVLPLSDDLLHAAGPRRNLFVVSQDWERGRVETVEGPSPAIHDGLFYVFYSGSSWRGDYAMGYAVSASPLGPFVKGPENPILTGRPDRVGPGGGSVFEDGRGGWWLAYHGWTAAGRALYLQRLAWTLGRPRVLD